MLFNSYVFIFCFLPVTLAVFFLITKFGSKKIAKIWLTLASIFFYGYWNIAYVPLLLLSVVANYYLGKIINEVKPGSKQAKALLWLGIGGNLGLIIYYKYAGFFTASANSLLNINFLIPEVVLPLGISFYTFTQIAYLVDCYRGETKNYDFLTYFLFITFYPQLIAGPLLLHSELIPQLEESKTFRLSYKNLVQGLAWFCLGLAKKLLFADSVSALVGPVFEHASEVSFFEAWLGALSYTLQLYFDFSGYSDMAIGLALMVNIHLPINFNSPYKATSIVDFWRRWHITLSRFLRDYLYIPLGGNRLGETRRYFNLMVTMLLGGLWHGAGWTFVIWGGLHGAFLVINHKWQKLGISIPAIFAWAITFASVVVGWVFFRASSIQDATQILLAMLGMKQVLIPSSYQHLFQGISIPGVQFVDDLPYWRDPKAVVALLLCALLLPNTQQLMKHFKPNLWWAIAISCVATLSLFSMNRISEFLYFQF
ncbi:MAG: MBOAT family protein [Elainellaceae cyanobacterium]